MMKNLLMAVTVATALLSATPVFADESQKNNIGKSFSVITFEDAEKMEQLSEQDKKLKGGGIGSWYFSNQPKWYLILNNVWLPYHN